VDHPNQAILKPFIHRFALTPPPKPPNPIIISILSASCSAFLIS
jgi:hypothetical protein